MTLRTGLRFKIIATLLGAMLLIGFVASGILQKQLTDEALQQEKMLARKDLQRLMLALDQQLIGLQIVLGSWSNYTSFYQHAASPNTAFRRDELSPAALSAAHFDWLLLLDPKGRITEQSEVAMADGTLPLTLALSATDFNFKTRIDPLIRAAPADCTLAQLSGRLSLTCYAPLLTTDAKGPPRGTVVIGRWIDAEILDVVRGQTNLSFNLEVLPLREEMTTGEVDIVSKVGRGRIDTEESGDVLSLHYPLSGMSGLSLGRVNLSLPRTAKARMDEMRHFVLKVVLVLALFSAVVMVVIVDLLVVKRINRLNRQLTHIFNSESWDGQLTVKGRDELTQLARSFTRMMDLIRGTLNDLRALSLTDTLTGLANRRRYDDRIALLLRQFHRDARVGALIVFDVDNFKRYNDMYGHPAGDAALITVARALAESVGRPVDLVARLGGEEFALLLALTDLDGARVCGERVLKTLLAKQVPHAGNEPVGFLTLSGGIAVTRQGDTPDSIYARADAALYRAKHSGRNRVETEEAANSDA